MIIKNANPVNQAFSQCKFCSLTKLPKPVGVDVSNKMEKTFKIEIDKVTGEKKLVEDGKTNIYEQIQAATPGTTIREILKKYEQGDVSVLAQMESRKGEYGDFTDVPTSWTESMQRIVDAEQMFMKLPVEVREEFNHSPTQFLAQAGTDRMKRIINKYKPKNEQHNDVAPTEAAKVEGQQSMFKEEAKE